MSVVPLLLKNDATVADTKDAFEAAGGTKGGAALILGMDPRQLAGQSSNVSYDLRIGKEYKDHRDAGKHALSKDGTIVFPPGTAVIIETEEFLHLPRTLFAFVVPKVRLLQDGLSNTMLKVDPGYQGHLLVTLFNLGKTTVTLKRGASFCSLCILRVEEGAVLYGKAGKSIEGPIKRPWWQSARDFLERNAGALTTLHILATLGLIIVQALHMLEQ